MPEMRPATTGAWLLGSARSVLRSFFAIDPLCLIPAAQRVVKSGILRVVGACMTWNALAVCV
jgi:hypothetical protein